MILKEFHEHPVLLGNEVVDENGTANLASILSLMEIKLLMKMILGKFHEHRVFVVK